MKLRKRNDKRERKNRRRERRNEGGRQGGRRPRQTWPRIIDVAAENLRQMKRLREFIHKKLGVEFRFPDDDINPVQREHL
ncbi:hypothetical protein E2C01_102203 [Portunus trituberculatus]|uniref:Uncharacterized protein n=1 Tax=Portunus trituberculatus TaxID=210409 RepID=A0A5B7KHR4_PORTR|nr:hypothetical protein [Portunus trituberculatus]